MAKKYNNNDKLKIKHGTYLGDKIKVLDSAEEEGIWSYQVEWKKKGGDKIITWIGEADLDFDN